MALEFGKIENPMEIIKFSLETQNKQGQALVAIINHVEGIKSDVDEKFSEMSVMLQEVKDSVTLSYEEQKKLQSTVFKTSVDLTKQSFEATLLEPTKEEFLKEVGSFRRAIWKKLKDKYDVPRYTSLRRVDYQYAIDFVNSLTMKDFLNI
jgi:hypothetical protein